MSFTPLKRKIKNFLDDDSIEIQGVHHGEELVMITQGAGSMRFQFAMTPDRAREMAEALLDSAYEIEQQFIQELESQEIPNDD
jgi:tRNA threonylcarbamoyladenosine modification (KEOPS) complex Cgi121 subunit